VWFGDFHWFANGAGSATAVGPVLASPLPDFLGKFLPLGFRCFVDEPPAFIVCAASMFKRGPDVLSKGLCAGIELACPNSSACSRP
jgi:hypothetical protein